MHAVINCIQNIVSFRTVTKIGYVWSIGLQEFLDKAYDSYVRCLNGCGDARRKLMII
jgi:hypothetical protein